jgi:hypothetical protein
MLNGTVIADTQTHNPFLGLLHNLLEYDKAFQDAYLFGTNGWVSDMNSNDAFMYMRHKHFIKGSKRLVLYGRLNHNLFTTKRPLLPGISIEIYLKGSRNDFCLIQSDKTDQKYKIVNNDCKLNVRRVQFREIILDSMDKLMDKGVIAKYPYTETKIHIFQVPKGAYHWKSLMFGFGSLPPQRYYFTFVEAKSMTGDWKNNPMVFVMAKYKVKYVQFLNNGAPLLDKPYELDFENNTCNKAYTDFVRVATNGLTTGRVPGITIAQYMDSYGILAFDNMPMHGNLEIVTKFAEETPRSLIGLLFTQNDRYFSYSKKKDIMPPHHR